MCQRALTAVLSVNDYYFDGRQNVVGRREVSRPRINKSKCMLT